MLSRSNVSEQLNAPTKKLFKAIDDKNLEAFKQAIAEGADVNAFDEEGMTPLMSIARDCDVTYGRQLMLEKMAKLLIQSRNININAKGKQPVYEERPKKDRHGRLVYLFFGQEVVEVQPGRYMGCNNGQLVDDMDDQGERRYFNPHYDVVKEKIRTSKIQENTALHIACQIGTQDVVKILLTHPDIKTGIKNRKGKSPKERIAGGFEEVIEREFEKAQRGRQLLDALSSRSIHLAKTLLNEELNPNCWERNLNEEIETPLSLIITLCPEKITENGKEVLTKFLKHKELDFSQIKSMPAVKQNIQLKRIIEQAIKERLTGAIDGRDLDDVKGLVDDNCFINHAIVTAALRDASKTVKDYLNEKFSASRDASKTVKDYLNEKFSASVEQPVASTNDIPVGSEQVIQELKGELERTKAQLTEKEQELIRERTRDTDKISQLERDLVQVRQEKAAQQGELIQYERIVCGRTNDTDKISQLERDLKQVREERDRLSSENRLLRTKSLSNKNKKPSQAISPGKKQSNYTSASFVLSGAFAVGACLTMPDLEICIPLAVAALSLFLIGCYCSYKANTALSNVKSTQLGNVISLE